MVSEGFSQVQSGPSRQSFAAKHCVPLHLSWQNPRRASPVAEEAENSRRVWVVGLGPPECVGEWHSLWPVTLNGSQKGPIMDSGVVHATSEIPCDFGK